MRYDTEPRITVATTLGNLTTRRPAFMHLAAGTLDRAPALRIKFHVYVGSKASWYEIADSYPRFDELPLTRLNRVVPRVACREVIWLPHVLFNIIYIMRTIAEWQHEL
ncbi:MAG: hypothetical protein WAU56_09145 [Steroidobacteraceae bacterium]